MFPSCLWITWPVNSVVKSTGGKKTHKKQKSSFCLILRRQNLPACVAISSAHTKHNQATKHPPKSCCRQQVQLQLINSELSASLTTLLSNFHVLQVNTKRLARLLAPFLRALKPHHRVLLVGTTRRPFQANFGPFCKAYQKIILIPRPDYLTRFGKYFKSSSRFFLLFKIRVYLLVILRAALQLKSCPWANLKSWKFRLNQYRPPQRSNNKSGS